MRLGFIKLGKKGEKLAAKHLESIGYQIKHKNLHVSTKEVDIICEDGEYIVFVEVKTVRKRPDGTYPARPSSYVTQKKKNNLIIAAQYYMNKYMPPLIPRIDVVEVYLDGKDATIEHIRSAVNRNQLILRSKKR